MKVPIVNLHRLHKVLLVLLCISVFSGCEKGIRQGRVLTIGIDKTIQTLDPAMHRSREVEAVVRNICDGLVTRDDGMRVVNETVESWRLIDENTWWFELRKGITFHNGDELTAEDVKFTIERIITPNSINGQNSPRKGLLGEVSGVEVVDSSHFLIRTDKPYPILMSMLPFQEIVPRNYIRTVGDAYFADHPVGCGPFRLVKWKKGERIILEKFDNYYGGSVDIPPVGPARVDRVIFRPIPETSVRISALLSGDIDIATNIPPHSVDVINKNPHTHVAACEGTRTYFIGMNCSEGPFSDTRVRVAVNMAVDLERIADMILGGYTTVLAGPLVPKAFGFDGTLKRYEYNPDEAVRLLREAGYPDGFEVELDAEEGDKDMAEAIASHLNNVGIKIRVRIWKWNILYPLLKDRSRKMFLTHWGNASLDPADIIVPLFKSDERGNFMAYSNPKVDELIDISQTAFDMGLRRKCFIEVQRILHDESPCLFGYTKKEIYGVRDRVRNWNPRPDGMLHMHRVSVDES